MQSYKLYTLIASLFLLGYASKAQTAKSYGVLLQRQGSSTPVQLVWDFDNTTSAYKVFRKLPDAKLWGTAIATLTPSDTTYTDNTVSSGTWEYYVQRTLINGKLGHGYLLTNVNVEPLRKNGRLLLAIDANYQQPLATEIAALISDLVGDGYTVDTLVVNRNEAVTAVKQEVMNWYYQYRNSAIKPQALYLLGRVPVPYSGVIYPDGHTPDHKGAWPADVYYGLQGEEAFTDTWADMDSATGTRNDNVPGDGKFDVDLFYPDSTVLEIGRVDLTNMTSFGMSDTLLVKQYLTKAHAFKTRAFVPNREAVIEDNFGAMSGEAFSSSGWRSFTSALGRAHVQSADYLSAIKQQSFLFSYGCGGGTFTSASGIASTNDFNSDSIHTVFTMLFGSYFGDWDSPNNFLRAPLCSRPSALVSVWSGRPHWNLHHMALGYSIGFSAKTTQNNLDGQLLQPKSNSGYVTNAFPTYVHIALMGDPSLRLFYQPMVMQLTATPNVDSTQCTITWSKQNNAVAYHVYRATNAFTPGDLIGVTTDSVWLTENIVPGNNYIYVRAKYIEESASGKFEQLSLAAKTVFVGGRNAVGLHEAYTNQLQVTLFPNPSKGLVSIAGDFKQASIKVFDISGKLMFETENINPMQPMELNLNSGLYVVEVKSKEGIGYRKLLIE